MIKSRRKIVQPESEGEEEHNQNIQKFVQQPQSDDDEEQIKPRHHPDDDEEEQDEPQQPHPTGESNEQSSQKSTNNSNQVDEKIQSASKVKMHRSRNQYVRRTEVTNNPRNQFRKKKEVFRPKQQNSQTNVVHGYFKTNSYRKVLIPFSDDFFFFHLMR